jgi:hybrid cluster-associated redox disulfide protein
MITPDMSIASVMRLDPEVAPVFMSFGMHCLYCPHASAESLAEASLVHGIDVNDLVKALNAYFDGKK